MKIGYQIEDDTIFVVEQGKKEDRGRPNKITGALRLL
jgi:hypothetical protein